MEDTPRRTPLAAAVRLPEWFIASPMRYLGLLVAVVLVQWSLFRAEAVFTGISGYPTLDTQNDLTVSRAQEQIGSYTPQAVEAYELFAVIDYLFPLAAAILLSANLLWLIRVANRQTSWRVPESLALVGMLPTLFDYIENIFMAASVATDGSTVLLTVAIVAKGMKLITLAVAAGLQLVALIYAITVTVRRRRINRIALPKETR